MARRGMKRRIPMNPTRTTGRLILESLSSLLSMVSSAIGLKVAQPSLAESLSMTSTATNTLTPAVFAPDRLIWGEHVAAGAGELKSTVRSTGTTTDITTATRVCQLAPYFGADPGYIFYSSEPDLLRVNENGSSKTTIKSGGVMDGVCVDSVAGKVYYLTSTGTLRRCDLDGSNDTQLASGLSTNTCHMALDQPNGLIYYINVTGTAICRISTAGTGNTTLIAFSTFGIASPTLPQGICIDKQNSKIYATCAKSGANNRYVVRCNMDGSSPTIIIDYVGDSGTFLGITCLPGEQKLYWGYTGGVGGGEIRECTYAGASHTAYKTSVSTPDGMFAS